MKTRVWVRCVEDIEKDQRFREMVKDHAYIDAFVIFTVKKLFWVMKDKGESWIDQYFHDTISVQTSIFFLEK